MIEKSESGHWVVEKFMRPLMPLFMSEKKKQQRSLHSSLPVKICQECRRDPDGFLNSKNQACFPLGAENRAGKFICQNKNGLTIFRNPLIILRCPRGDFEPLLAA